MPEVIAASIEIESTVRARARMLGAVVACALSFGCDASRADEGGQLAALISLPPGRDVFVGDEVVVELIGAEHADLTSEDDPFLWSLSWPSWSDARLGESTNVSSVSFVPDIPGEYEVCFMGRALDYSWAEGCTTYTAAWRGGNGAPVLALAGTDYVVRVGDSVVIDASGSTDPDGDELELGISGSVPCHDGGCLGSVSYELGALVPTYTGERVGEETWELWVRDPRGAESERATVRIRVVDRWPAVETPALDHAAWSRPLDRLIASARTGSELLVIDAATGSAERIALPERASSLALSPDGMTAVAGGSDAVHVVSLGERRVTTRAVEGAVEHAVITDAGTVYFTNTGDHEILRTLHADGAVSASQSGAYPVSAGPLRLASDGTTILGAAVGSSAGLLRFSAGDGVAERVTSAGRRDQVCGNVWPAGDGTWALTRCGCRVEVGATSLRFDERCRGGGGSTLEAVTFSEGDALTSSGTSGAPLHFRGEELRPLTFAGAVPVAVRWLFTDAEGGVVAVVTADTGTRWGVARIPADELPSEE